MGCPSNFVINWDMPAWNSFRIPFCWIFCISNFFRWTVFFFIGFRTQPFCHRQKVCILQHEGFFLFIVYFLLRCFHFSWVICCQPSISSSDLVVEYCLLSLDPQLFSVMSTILNISGVWSVGCPTVITSWCDVMFMALIAALGDLHPAIIAEHNVVCFFNIVQLP